MPDAKKKADGVVYSLKCQSSSKKGNMTYMRSGQRETSVEETEQRCRKNNSAKPLS